MYKIPNLDLISQKDTLLHELKGNVLDVDLMTHLWVNGSMGKLSKMKYGSNG